MKTKPYLKIAIEEVVEHGFLIKTWHDICLLFKANNIRLSDNLTFRNKFIHKVVKF